MKCLFVFGIASMKEDTSAHLSGRGEFDGGAKIITLGTWKNVLKTSKRVIKMIKCHSSTPFKVWAGLGLDQAPGDRHGSDAFLVSTSSSCPSDMVQTVSDAWGPQGTICLASTVVTNEEHIGQGTLHTRETSISMNERNSIARSLRLRIPSYRTPFNIGTCHSISINIDPIARLRCPNTSLRSSAVQLRTGPLPQCT